MTILGTNVNYYICINTNTICSVAYEHRNCELFPAAFIGSVIVHNIITKEQYRCFNASKDKVIGIGVEKHAICAKYIV
jgi:hypothetical protein